MARSRALAPLRAAVRAAEAEAASLATRGVLTEVDRQQLAQKRRLLQDARDSAELHGQTEKLQTALESSAVSAGDPCARHVRVALLDKELAAAIRAGSRAELRPTLRAAEAEGAVSAARLSAARAVRHASVWLPSSTSSTFLNLLLLLYLLEPPSPPLPS